MFVTIVSVMLFVEIFLSHFADFQKGRSRQQCLHIVVKLLHFSMFSLCKQMKLFFGPQKIKLVF